MENSEIKIKKIKFNIKVTIGLTQGDALSPAIFNIVLEKVVRDMNKSEDLT